jgi:GntR family transcriptional regulator
LIPFRVQFRPGISVYEQIVYASKKAIIVRQLRPGDPFPSVRHLSRELKINPNTAHKVISHLVTDGLLEIRPGIGAVVASARSATRAERAELLGRQIEELVVEAKKLGVGLDEVLESMTAHWKRLGGNQAMANRTGGGPSVRERRHSHGTTHQEGGMSTSPWRKARSIPWSGRTELAKQPSSRC